MFALSDQQELALLLRFGQGARPATPEEVADTLGMSTSAIERIEDEALRLLRRNAIDPLAKGWNGWDEV